MVVLKQRLLIQVVLILCRQQKIVTINLDIKFVSAKLNDQLLGKVKVLKTTKTLVFIYCEILDSTCFWWTKLSKEYFQIK